MDKIFVVTHIPPTKELLNGYSWIKVGSGEFNVEFCDSIGDSISDKNPSYCELTALYWIWKNFKSEPDDLIGLSHYRRFFGLGGAVGAFNKSVIFGDQVRPLMSDIDVIVPAPVHFKNGLFGNYVSDHVGSDLEACIDVLKNSGWLTKALHQKFLNEKHGVLYNMFVMRRNLLDEYCEWLFPVLFAAEPKIQLDSRSRYQRRAFGFLGERLFNLWLWSKPQINLLYLPVIRTDKSRLSNLNNVRKIFLRRLSGRIP